MNYTINLNLNFTIICILNICLSNLLVLGYFFSIASIQDNGFIDELYLTQECIGYKSNKTCGDIDPVFINYFTILYALFITLGSLLIMQIVVSWFNKSIIVDIIGIFIIGIAIGLVIMLGLISRFTRGNTNYKLSAITVAIMTLASLSVITQIGINKSLHKLVLAPVRMLSRK